MRTSELGWPAAEARGIRAGLEQHMSEDDTLLGLHVEQSHLHRTRDHLRQLGIEVVEFQTHDAGEDP